MGKKSQHQSKLSCHSRYSEKIGFRERSETADIAVELSLQPWRAFRPDGVIMFSDILTPLPAMGIEFDVVKGKGPIIEAPIKRCPPLPSFEIISSSAKPYYPALGLPLQVHLCQDVWGVGMGWDGVDVSQACQNVCHFDVMKVTKMGMSGFYDRRPHSAQAPPH